MPLRVLEIYYYQSAPRLQTFVSYVLLGKLVETIGDLSKLQIEYKRELESISFLMESF